MNEFVRTFSKAFNEIHRTGEDLNGDKGLDFFNGTDIKGDNFVFDEEEDYYKLTAANFTVTDKIYDDPDLIAIAKDIDSGVEDKTVLDALNCFKK